jgi:Cu+-exporting ATPase
MNSHSHGHGSVAGNHPGGAGPSHSASGSVDPVCGMTVPADSPHRVEHDGTALRFCSAGCRSRFIADPARYLKPAPFTAAPTGPGTRYTCPMHPEIVRDTPVNCPICGMALEPLMPAAEVEDTTREVRIKFWTSALLSLPLLATTMGPHLVGWHPPAAWARVAPWTELLLASIVVLWGGSSFFARGWRSLRPWRPNMYTLIGLGTGVAWAYSVVAVLAPQVFPAGFRDEQGRVGLYFEAAAVIVTLVLLGEWLEQRARQNTGAAIRALLSLAPPTALRIGADNREEEVPLAHVHVGDRLRVRPG